MSKRCETCKHWERGYITTFAEDATYSDGKPHEKRGQSITVRPLWDCHAEGQDVGECNAADGPLFAAVCAGEGIYGQLVTDAQFGCRAYEEEESPSDHYQRMSYPRTDL